MHAIALRCQVRIEPQRRRYDEAEEAGLRGLFGERERWADTLRPFLWMQCSTMVQGFTGLTEVDLPLPCTYDFEVTGSRYLHALGAGEVPLVLLFSGTVFTRGSTGFGVEQVPWDCEAAYRLPVTVWQDMIAPTPRTPAGSGWTTTCSTELSDFRARHGLTSWEETVQRAARRTARRGGVMSLDQVRAVADAVLYEGYLLYPYRASSAKNQSRWQFGVLGPPDAAPAAFAEDPALAMQCLLEPDARRRHAAVDLRPALPAGAGTRRRAAACPTGPSPGGAVAGGRRRDPAELGRGGRARGGHRPRRAGGAARRRPVRATGAGGRVRRRPRRGARRRPRRGPAGPASCAPARRCAPRSRSRRSPTTGWCGCR